MRPLNPYIAGNPIRDQTGFYGREDVFRKVNQVLHQPSSNALVLYGQRRIGKTSALLQLEQRLAHTGEYTPILFDLQDKSSKHLAEVLYELAQQTAGKVGRPSPARDCFADEGDYFRQTFMPGVTQFTAPGGIVFLFDEFDVLDSPQTLLAGQAFFPYLRQWMFDVQKVRFIFVIGRRPEDLSIETLSTFKGVPAERVSLLDRKDTDAVVRQSERNQSLFWAEDAVTRVWDWTHGHPYFTQLLCSAVWEAAYESQEETTPRVEPAAVDAAIGETLKQGANAFSWIWNGLPPAERVVMSAMAEAGDTIITRDKLVELLNRSGVRLIRRELEIAPETLQEWELLEPQGNGYRFKVPLLRHWVASHRPLRRVKNELDQLDPLAESLFKAAQAYYSNGELTDAENQLRQALKKNPTHLKAHLLLGRVLLETNKTMEAIAILEETFKYDSSSRGDLVSALLAHAATQSGDEQLATYERVLSLDAYQVVALEHQHAIWNARGAAALKANDLENAQRAFERAGNAEQVAQINTMRRERALETRFAWAKFWQEREDWETALKIYEEMRKELPDSARVNAALDLARKQQHLLLTYNQAIGALETGNCDQAKRLLAEVISISPEYKEAPLYLLAATRGTSIKQVRGQLRQLPKTQGAVVASPAMPEQEIPDWLKVLAPEAAARLVRKNIKQDETPQGEVTRVKARPPMSVAAIRVGLFSCSLLIAALGGAGSWLACFSLDLIVLLVLFPDLKDPRSSGFLTGGLMLGFAISLAVGFFLLIQTNRLLQGHFKYEAKS